MADVRNVLKRWVRRAGYDIKKLDAMHALTRRMLLLEHYGIDVLFDVGANVGQYAILMRELGYRGRIVSFEPLAQAFSVLARRAGRDPRWEAVHTALGAAPGEGILNVAQNPECSSLLDVTPTFTAAAPSAAFVAQETIAVTTLDAVFGRFVRPGERAYLKIDAQGYEQQVLAGASASLEDILGVQMELSLVPLYEGERLLADMVADMDARGYTMMSLEPVHATAAGQLLQVDGIFYRRDAKPVPPL